MVAKQEIDIGHFVNQKEKFGRSMLLSKIGALKSSVIKRTDCILVETQSGWILHIPLAKGTKGVVP